VSWLCHNWDMTDRSREFLSDEQLECHSWDKCNSHQDLLQNHLLGHDRPSVLDRDLSCLVLFWVLDPWALFRLLLAW